MVTIAAQSAGGKATAKILREKAIKNYYINPNICKQCLNIIHVKDKEKVSNTKAKKFCSKSCSAKYGNPKRIRIKKEKPAKKRKKKI